MLRYFLLLLPLIVLLACGKTDNAQGRYLYEKHCANCHMAEGEGLRQLIPPLAGSDYLRDNPREVIRGMRYGMKGPLMVNGVRYNQPMPGNVELTDFQIVNIANYLNQAWGNDYPPVTLTQTREWLAE